MLASHVQWKSKEPAVGQRETEQLNEILFGTSLASAICTAAELGVADHIRRGLPRSARHLAESTGSLEGPLYRLLRLLASHGLFTETSEGEFDHTALSEALRTDADGSYRAAAQMFHRIFAVWSGLDHAVRTGQPGFDKIYGKPAFDYVAEHPDLGPILDAGMSSIHGYETWAMLDVYDFSGVKVLADIGGGNGSLLGAVLQQYPQMRGLLFDRDHVAERARRSLGERGLSDRCEVLEGSFFESVPAGADAYLFRHILHDWTDEQCLQILRHCRRVIPAQGRLLVVECIVPAGNGRSISKEFDITMMNFPGGLERTEAQFRALFANAGFELSSLTPTATMVSIAEGRPISR
jgi:ubiquinone/menaquinone biosynthesis C-methylase UbiE